MSQEDTSKVPPMDQEDTIEYDEHGKPIIKFVKLAKTRKKKEGGGKGVGGKRVGGARKFRKAACRGFSDFVPCPACVTRCDPEVGDMHTTAAVRNYRVVVIVAVPSEQIFGRDHHHVKKPRVREYDAPCAMRH